MCVDDDTRSLVSHDHRFLKDEPANFAVLPVVNIRPTNAHAVHPHQNLCMAQQELCIGKYVG